MKDPKFFSTQDLIEEFADAIEENNFSNCIVETTSEGEIEIKIDYDTDERKIVNELGHDR